MMADVEFSSSFAIMATFSFFFALVNAMGNLAFTAGRLPPAQNRCASMRTENQKRLRLAGDLRHRGLELNARPHRGADDDALDVLALGCRGLRLHHRADH